MKIKAERTEGRYLKLGDIFSITKPENVKTISIPVFLCINPPEDDDKELIYRITIENETKKPIEKNQGPQMDPHRAPGT